MVISRMKTGDVTDAARIEEKIFSMPWSEQSFLEALEQEYTCLLYTSDAADE